MSKNSDPLFLDEDCKYECINFSPNTLTPDTTSNEAWKRTCERLVQYQPDLYQSLNKADFFEFYEPFCNLDTKSTRTRSDSDFRTKMCERCNTLKCARCTYPIFFSKKNVNCTHCKIYLDNTSFTEPESCFLHDEFRKITHVKLDGCAGVFDPSVTCRKCKHCTAEEKGTEVIVLHDLPLNLHPTEVSISRKLYARKHGTSNPNICPTQLPEGILNSPNSRLTSRLYAACLSALLASPYHLPFISEWYCVSKPYLYKMRKKQAERVEAGKAKARTILSIDVSRMGSTSSTVNGNRFTMYFCVPSYTGGYKQTSMELIGIYSEEELHYLKELMSMPLTWDSIGKTRPDISSCRVFSMAYDFAAEKSSHIPPPADIFAATMAIVDAFLCTPLPDTGYELWAIYRQMLEFLKSDASVLVLLSLAKASINHIPSSLSDCDLTLYSNYLVQRLEAILSEKGNCRISKLCHYALTLSTEEEIYANRIAELVTETMEAAQLMDGNSRSSNDDGRDSILFFNQVVIPYTYEQNKNNTPKYHPVFDQYGNIDTSGIHTMGVRCACLEHILRNTGLNEQPPYPLSCKSIHSYAENYNSNFPCDRHCQDE